MPGRRMLDRIRASFDQRFPDQLRARVRVRPSSL
jgi:hypothetical protein